MKRSNGAEIQTCVPLGLGSFAGDHEGNEANPFYASMTQLVAFEAYVEIIADHQGARPPTFIQDPEFNSLDYQFLMSRGHSIIHPPATQAVITESSLLYTPSAPYEVFLTELSRVFPALYLGNDLQLDHDETFSDAYLCLRMLEFMWSRETVSVALSTYNRDAEGVCGSSANEPDKRYPQDWEIWHPLYYIPKEYNDDEIARQIKARKVMIHRRFPHKCLSP